MVGVPDANVQEDVPAGTTVGVNASDLEGSVMASRHASTLEVVITTQERASTYLDANGARVGSGGDGLALVLRDDTHDAGRTVALPAGVVKETLGYLPETVYGRHDDGTRWRRNVEAGSGLLRFDVPHFSNNTVTFSGEVGISATPATDGSSYTYSLTDKDAVNNLSVQFTGDIATERDVESGRSVSVAGNMAPTNEEITVSGSTTSQSKTVNSFFADSYTFDNPPSTVDEVEVLSYENQGETDVTVYEDGTQIASETFQANADESLRIQNLGATPTDSIQIDLNSEYTGSGGELSITSGYPRDVNVSVNGTTKSFGTVSSAESKSFDLPLGSSDISVSKDKGGSVSVETTYTERTRTENPAVIINGNTATHVGELDSGETVTLNPLESYVQEGTNRVNVSVADTLSSDAPDGSVEMVYSHEAIDEQSVTYESETWTERYNFSRYYASETNSASVTVPFNSDVLAVRTVKYRIDGGSWVEVNDYTLQNTTLTAQVGHVPAGSTLTVVANGSRVDVRDGSIQVTEPTTSGNTLATEFRVESAGPDFRIDVSGTAETQYLHYLTNESWTAPAEYSIVRADGQALYVPNVSAGATATARSYSMEVHPQNDVRVRLVEAGDTPEFDIGPGNVEGDEVEFVLYGAASGETYKLESLEDGKIWDKGEANSPVRLTMEDTHDSLVIALVEALTGGGGGGGGGGVAPLVSTGAGNPLVPPWIMLGLGGGVLLLGGVVVSRAGVPVWVYGPVAALVGLVTVETLAPGAVSYTFAEVGTLVGARLAGVVGDVSAPILLAGAGLLLWGAYRVIRRLTRRQNVTLRLRRGG
jgi:hypothetical protein